MPAAKISSKRVILPVPVLTLPSPILAPALLKILKWAVPGKSSDSSRLTIPTKQLVWKAGALGVAASRRTPFTTVSDEVKVAAENVSTVKPWPCGLLTREKPANNWKPPPAMLVCRNPNWLPAARSGQISRRLALATLRKKGTTKSGHVSGVAWLVLDSGKYRARIVMSALLGFLNTKRCAKAAVSTTTGNTW